MSVSMVLILTCFLSVTVDDKVREIDLVGVDQLIDGAEFISTGVSKEGRIKTAPTTEYLKLDPQEQSIWSYYRLDNNNYLLGTGKGNIYRLSEGTFTKEFETGQELVTSFRGNDGLIYATTIPNGKIYVRKGGGWSELVSLSNKYIWDSYLDHDGTLYVSCGEPASIVRVFPDGKHETYLEMEVKSFNVIANTGRYFICSTRDPNYIVSLKGQEKGRVLYDLEKDELTTALPYHDRELLLVLNQHDGKRIDEKLDLTFDGEEKAGDAGAKEAEDDAHKGPAREEPGEIEDDTIEIEVPEKIPDNDNRKTVRPSTIYRLPSALRFEDMVSGTWQLDINMSISFNNMEQKISMSGTMELQLSDGNDISGDAKLSMEVEGIEAELKEEALSVDGKLNGKDIELKLKKDGEKEALLLTGAVDAEAGTMSGTGRPEGEKQLPPGATLEITWEAKRQGSGTAISNGDKKASPGSGKSTSGGLKGLSKGAKRSAVRDSSAVIALFDGNLSIISRVPFYPSDAALSNEGIILSSAFDGKLYELDFNEQLSLIMQMSEASITKVTLDGGLKVFTSSGPFVVKLGDGYNGSGSYISKAIEQKGLVDWLWINTVGEGLYTLQTRSGNTPDPDEGGWSDWSSAFTGGHGKVPSPPGKYLQFRINFTDNESYVERITVGYRLFNRRPEVKSLTLQPVQQPGQPEMVTIQVVASDPDGDKLEFRLLIKRIDEKEWAPLLSEPLKTPGYSLNSRELPDGRYQVKAIASDVMMNYQTPREEAMISPVFTIDNTPPVMTIERDKNGWLVVNANDETGIVRQISYRVNGQDKWTEAESSDGYFDSGGEKAVIALDETVLREGLNTIFIRAVDGKGNTSLRQLELEK